MKQLTLLALLALGACSRVPEPPQAQGQARQASSSREEMLRLAQQQSAVVMMVGNLTAIDELRQTKSRHLSETDGQSSERRCEGHLLALKGEKAKGFAGYVKVVNADRRQTTVWTVTEDRDQAEAAMATALAKYCQA
jgi:hypothetical protein